MSIRSLTARVSAQPAEPAAARAALRAGELERALELARQAVALEPSNVDALTVLGMALAKNGDAAEALSRFDAAIDLAGAAASPGLLWNRGACLAALARTGEAERAFIAAAARAEPALAALCWLNAGFAALDAGSAARATAHLARARELDQAHALAVELADLDAELSAHARSEHARLYAYLARGELEPAQRELARACAERPDDAVLAYLAGLVAYRQQRDRAAELQLRRSLALGLDAERQRLAQEYLDLIAGGIWLAGRGLHADLELGGGYDSNAVQAGLGDSNPLLGVGRSVRGGAYGRARADLGYGLTPSAASFVLARYAFEQLAYAPRALDVWNAQQHDLAFEAEQRFAGGFRVGALAHGGLEAAGLADLRAFALSAGGELSAGLELQHGLRARLGASASHTAVIDAAFADLSGTRLQLDSELTYARGGLRAGSSLGYRGELLGTQRVAATLPDDRCEGCRAVYDIPLGYEGPRAALWLSYRLLDWLRASARVAGELRAHRAPAYLAVTTPGAVTTREWERRERDRRLALGAGLTFALFDPLELDVDYDATIAGSNIDNSSGGQHMLDYANLVFVRHVLSLGVAAHF